MWESKLTEEPKPTNNKRSPQLAMIGGGVVLAASLVTVLVVSNNKAPDTPTPESISVDPADDQIARIQFGQNGQTTAPAEPATPDPAAPVASADGALAFVDKSIDFSAAIPPGPADDPVLTYLRTDAQAYLRKFKANARADFDERKRQDAAEMQWAVKIDWKYTAKADGLVSLVGTAYEFTGGAHGMTFIDTHIARVDSGEQLELADMLLPDRSPSPAITIAVCEALKKEKLRLIGSATIYDEPIVCAGLNTNIKIEEARFALAPSTEANRFGGLFVYYEPYAVGSYSEGEYSVTIPNEVFNEDLRPQYRNLFSGPVPPTAVP